jgi:hypothetical protein
LHCKLYTSKKDALRVMVISKEWTSSPCAREAKARQFVDLVLDQKFGKIVVLFVTSRNL